MQFDGERIYRAGEIEIPVGYVYGGDAVVVIKSGLGGSHVGYEKKYVRIARRLNERYGASVLSVSNPMEDARGAEHDEQILRAFLAERAIAHPRLYFFGHSNGALCGLSLAERMGTFQKLVLINAPLMINFHKTVRLVRALAATRIDAVFGSRDPSQPHLPLFSDCGAHLHVFTVGEADHHFRGKMEEFIRCADLLFTP